MAEMMRIEGVSLFNFTQTNRIKQEQQVYVDIQFDQRYTFNPLHVLSVTVVEKILEEVIEDPASQKPEFSESLQDQDYKVESSLKEFRYSLPEINDQDPETVTIELMTDLSFIQLEGSEIVLYGIQKANVGTHQV